MERFLRNCESAWPEGQPGPRVVTRAPGRIDCLGGMADFSGCLALQMPTQCCAYVAAGPRRDQRVRVETIDWANGGQPCVFEWPLSAFYQSDGQIVTAEQLVKHVSCCPWARHIAGICLALLDSGEMPHLAGGANILISCDIPDGRGLAASAAIQVAVAQAVAGLLDIELSTAQLLRICRTANAEVIGGETGLVDHISCLLGEADCLLQVRCPSHEVLGTLILPKDVTFAAVDAGPRSEICRSRYQENRIAAYMGRMLIERLSGRNGCMDDTNGGCLASVSPTEYVNRFRNELPVKLKGQDFLDRYGQPDGLDTLVRPDQTYKVRSRSEHHIYENDRAHRFVERLSRARRTGDRDALVEAGELLYASHWSYSQRCGLGSLEADWLVTEIRTRGPSRGLYGAKLTGLGCGGAVAVLMSQNAHARAALDEACAAYRARTGRPALIHAGSSPGAKTFGRRYLG